MLSTAYALASVHPAALCVEHNCTTADCHPEGLGRAQNWQLSRACSFLSLQIPLPKTGKDTAGEPCMRRCLRTSVYYHCLHEKVLRALLVAVPPPAPRLYPFCLLETPCRISTLTLEERSNMRRMKYLKRKKSEHKLKLPQLNSNYPYNVNLVSLPRKQIRQSFLRKIQYHCTSGTKSNTLS